MLGNPKFVKFYKDMVVANDKRYGFEIHCLDFLNITSAMRPITTIRRDETASTARFAGWSRC